MESYLSFIRRTGRDNVIFVASIAATTLICYYIWLGKPHSLRRKYLETQLSKAQQTVHELEEKLLALERSESEEMEKTGKEIRIWMDGAFDMMHYGHMNAFRQARALGTKLYAGVNSDESIIACKGKPVNNDAERMACVRGCRWVDEVVTDVPYIMNEEYILHIIEKYKIDYIVHGDDPCFVDGKDVFETAKKMGKFLTIPRTEGISSTDIVGRMLLFTCSHHSASPMEAEESSLEGPARRQVTTMSSGQRSGYFDRKSNFLTTSRTIRQFGAEVKAPGKNDRIVYLAGSWDMFHAGHVAVLEKAREIGDYVIVGVHSDAVVNKLQGSNYPIMNLHERVLSVLGCKFVDDVLIDAPYVITSDMIASLRIKAVVKGTVRTETRPAAQQDNQTASSPRTPGRRTSEVDPYVVPREMGILHTVESPFPLTVVEIVSRIHAQREQFAAKFERKMIAEKEYYDLKYAADA